MKPEFPKRLNLDLSERDWRNLKEAKEVSGAYSYAQTLREAVTRHLTIERERFRLEQERKGKV